MRLQTNFIKEWCKESSICEQTYYRWQKKLFEIAKAQQQGACFAEVTPAQATQTHNVAVFVRLCEAEADIRNGADLVTVETVLQILKSC